MTAPLIALIRPASGDHAAATRGAFSALQDSGHGLILFDAEPASPWLLTDMRHFLEAIRPKGAIVLPPLSMVSGIEALFAELACPLVRLAPRDLPGPPPALSSNDRQAMADATQYLIALGHKRIGLIAGPESCPSARECELGFIDALAAQALDRGAELVAASDGTIAGGEVAAALLLAVSPRPTAILAASDILAAGALRAAHAAGISVPDDLSLVGFGDGPLAEALPVPLTSLAPPWEEMAFAAAILLAVQKLAPEPARWFSRLIPRASSGPAPQAAKPPQAVAGAPSVSLVQSG